MESHSFPVFDFFADSRGRPDLFLWRATHGPMAACRAQTKQNPLLQEMTMPDAELAGSLRQAMATEMYFAFIPKGADGKLIVSRHKIPPHEIAEAKRQIGAGTTVTGKCLGPSTNMVFKVAKVAPATLSAALMRV